MGELSVALNRFGLPAPTFCRPEELTARWLDDATAAGTTAVLVESVNQLPLLAAMANLRGLSIPDDLSVALLVDDPAGDVGPGPWAALHIPRNAMGRRAARLLTTLLADPAGDHERQIMLPCTRTLEATVAPPR